MWVLFFILYRKVAKCFHLTTFHYSKSQVTV
nr:MAG TPA: hypothetical protein [Caudoviricetes sp.]